MGILTKARDISRTFSPTRWAIVIVAAAVMLAMAAWLITWPGRQAQKTADAQAGQAFGEARTGAATEAIAKQGEALNAANQNLQDARKDADAIRQAPGADQRLDPDLNRAGRLRTCRADAYRDTPECVQLLGRREPPR